MARKKDSEDDKQARLILSQLNSKTVGAPLSTTGLTGDQLPDTIFEVEDFDTIRNQINLQLSNVEALNLLNTLGQITNMQSQAGPIVGTSQIAYINGITNSHTTIFKPASGSVWQLFAASVPTLDGASTMILKLDDGTNQIVIDTHNSTSEPFELNEPIFISSDVWLIARTSDASSGNAIVGAAVVRVR